MSQKNLGARLGLVLPAELLGRQPAHPQRLPR